MEAVAAACKEFSVVITIFSFLDAKDICLRGALVCKYWAGLTKEPLLLVRRDHPTYVASEGDGDWRAVWRNLQVPSFNRNNTHPKISLSNNDRSGGNSDDWLLATVNREFQPDDGLLHYCEFEVGNLGSGNVTFGVADPTVDAASIKFNGWGFTGGWMTMAHSVNLCCGIPSYTLAHWSSGSNGRVNVGDRVGILVDCRRSGKPTPGASIFFAINGVCRPVAFTKIQRSLCFVISFCDDSPHTVSIVPHPEVPDLPSVQTID